MAKSDFWSSSLPRSLPRRKVKLSLWKQILKDFRQKFNVLKRWLLMMRLQNDRHLLLQLDSSQSTPWRISREFRKPITRLDCTQSKRWWTFKVSQAYNQARLPPANQVYVPFSSMNVPVGLKEGKRRKTKRKVRQASKYAWNVLRSLPFKGSVKLCMV